MRSERKRPGSSGWAACVQRGEGARPSGGSNLEFRSGQLASGKLGAEG